MELLATIDPGPVMSIHLDAEVSYEGCPNEDNYPTKSALVYVESKKAQENMQRTIDPRHQTERND